MTQQPDSTLGQPGARPDSLADRHEFLTSGLTPHDCESCGTRVLVKKNSPKHTSIQWTTDAGESCPVFAEQLTSGGSAAFLDTCPKLADSIQRAVRNGEVEVSSE